MATDIKELYPEKSVTLIHSRPTVMNRFHSKLDEVIKERCQELSLNLKLGSRVKVPANGYPTDGTIFNVELQDGSTVPADLAVSFTTLDDMFSQTDNNFADHVHRNDTAV